MSEHGTYETIDGRPALRFERRLPHPPGLVWRALTEPAELAHWFPALVERELEPGGKMTFTFADDGLPPSDGRVHELEPPRLFAFSWGEEELRFELEELADGRECLLRFTHLLEQRDQAANNAAGWHVCLDRLAAHLRGEAVEAPGTEMTDELRGLRPIRGPRRAEQLGREAEVRRRFEWRRIRRGQTPGRCARPTTRTLRVDALGDPAIAVARHHHATFAVAAERHEVGAVLVGAGTVVHEHQVKVVVGPPGARTVHGLASHGLHRVAVPAAIAGARLLERGVGGSHMLLVGPRPAPVARADAQQAADEEQDHQHAEDDADDAQCR